MEKDSLIRMTGKSENRIWYFLVGLCILLLILLLPTCESKQNQTQSSASGETGIGDLQSWSCRYSDNKLITTASGLSIYAGKEARFTIGEGDPIDLYDKVEWSIDGQTVHEGYMLVTQFPSAGTAIVEIKIPNLFICDSLRVVVLPLHLDPTHDFDEDGYTEDEGDCNDQSNNINPGMEENCNNDIDDNCDGQICIKNTLKGLVTKQNDSNITSDEIKESTPKSSLRIDTKTAKKTTWYADNEPGGGDGMGDPNNTISTKNGIPSTGDNWVSNSNDKCPERNGYGNPDGCPTLSIDPVNQKVYLSQQFEVSASNDGLLPADGILWTGSDNISFSKTYGLTTIVKANTVGYHTIKYNVNNPDNPILSEGSLRFHAGVTPEQVREIIQPIVVQGMSRGAGNFESQSQQAMKELFSHTVSKRITVEDETGTQLDALETFLTSDIKLGLPKGKHDLEILDIGYDVKGTGKIDYIQIKFL